MNISLGTYSVQGVKFDLTLVVTMLDDEVIGSVELPWKYPDTRLFSEFQEIININIQVVQNMINIKRFYFYPKDSYRDHIMTKEEQIIFKGLARKCLVLLVKWIQVNFSNLVNSRTWIHLCASGHVCNSDQYNQRVSELFMLTMKQLSEIAMELFGRIDHQSLLDETLRPIRDRNKEELIANIMFLEGNLGLIDYYKAKFGFVKDRMYNSMRVSLQTFLKNT
jgi:hypothetical protein